MLDAVAFKENERLAWNLCAERYDRCLTLPFTPVTQKLVGLARLTSGQNVLDVATGGGLAAFMSARQVGPEGRVTGIDLSDAMIELARNRAAKGAVENVDFLQMDAEELGFASQSFDTLLCALGLMLFPQPDKALSEMHRVLRQGGTLALSVFGRGSRVALRAFMDPFIPHMPPPPQRGPSTFGLGHAEVMREALNNAGFSRIRTEQESHVLSFDDVEDVWEMVISLGRLAQMHSQLSDSEGQGLQQAVLRIARDRYADRRGRAKLPFEVTYALADK